MSTLASLRDIAGCRAVLRDAQLEERPAAELCALADVVNEAEAAVWGGGECGAPVVLSSRRRITSPWKRRKVPRATVDQPMRRIWEGMARSAAMADWTVWEDGWRDLWYVRARGSARVRAVIGADLGYQSGDEVTIGTLEMTGMAAPMAGFGDILHERYDQHAEPGEVRGLGDWIPASPSGPGARNFYGVDRSVAPAPLAGAALRGETAPLSEETFEVMRDRLYHAGVIGGPDSPPWRSAQPVTRRAGATTSGAVRSLAARVRERAQGKAAHPDMFQPLARALRQANKPAQARYRPTWAPGLAATLATLTAGD